MSDKNKWTEDYLRMKPNLTEHQIDLLKGGPSSLCDSWLIRAMHHDYRKMMGIKDTERPNLQSSFKEFNKKIK